MEDIKEFFIDKLKEKHIVDNILQFYYEDWEELEFKDLNKRLYLLRKTYCPFPYNYSSNFTKVEIDRLERKLTFLRYKIMTKYEQIGNYKG